MIRRLQDEWGFIPLPCAPGEKHPYVDWTVYRDTPPSPEETSAWFKPGVGVWSVMGPKSGWTCLDIDNDEGEVLWRERIGELLDQTTCVRTRRGLHFFFKTPENEAWPTWKWEKDPEAVKRGAHFEVLGHGNGVMLPPSFFPDGPAEDGRERYEWVRGPEHALPAPDALRKPTGNAVRPRGGAPTPTRVGALAGLLASPAGEGGRNNWHAEVAGYLAKVIPWEDAFLALAQVVNAGTPNPLDAEEADRTWRSIWTREGDKGRPEAGWLSSDGRTMFVAEKTRKVPWLNGVIQVTGVINQVDAGRAYSVIVKRHGGQPTQDLVKAGMLGSAAETKRWLAKHGLAVTPLPPEVDPSNKMDPGARLVLYFEFQQPVEHQAVNWLGWHDGIGFVSHDGIITAEGLHPFDGVVPDPSLRERAPYVYGMGPEEEAKEILAEILTYQEEWVAAVFGSWWIMTFLKGQVMTQTGHFPYAIIEAASEAGKTRGMFSLLRTLSGSTQHGTGTKASIRDNIGANRSGIVHIDDAQSVDHLEELLREAPGEGFWTKKDHDNRANVNLKLVAPVMVSGEQMDLRAEKAHRDRSILIDGVPSPKSRMSLKDPSRPQIDDVMAMMSRDLTEYSGTMVKLALQHADLVNTIKQLRGAAGRHNEIMAVVRCGARVLDAILEREWAVSLVDSWAGAQEDLGAENTLVTKILPWLLLESQSTGWSPSHPGYFGFVDDRTGMWLHVPTAASIYQKEIRSRGKTDRLDSPEAITAQLNAMKAESKQKKLNGRNRWAWNIPDEYRGAVYRHAGLALPEHHAGSRVPGATSLPTTDRVALLTERSTHMKRT